jgi:hypothetical protein
MEWGGKKCSRIKRILVLNLFNAIFKNSHLEKAALCADSIKKYLLALRREVHGNNRE